MPSNEATDVLMTFIDKSGAGVAGECASVWNISDSMKDGFSAGTFFEVNEFSFSGGIKAEGSGSSNGSGGFTSSRGNNLSARPAPTASGQVKSTPKLPPTNPNDPNAKSKDRGSEFSKYIMGIKDWEKGMAMDVKEIEVTRQMDVGSPILFSSCVNLVSFTKAILVKRKIIGGIASRGVTVPLMGFFRIEFKEPLIISVDWDDGEVIKEKIKFVCRGGTIIYKPQKPDGSLGDQTSVTWTPRLNLTGTS
jgi:hypothetical protein